MSSKTKEIATMIDILPEFEQELACELIKRMVLAWDPDYTRVTPEEIKKISRSHGEMQQGKCLSFASAENMIAYFGVKV